MTTRTRRPPKPNRDGPLGTGDGLRAVIAVRIEGVLGNVQNDNDAVLVGSYEQDRANCEAAIQKAQDELNNAGEEVDDNEAALSLGWAWHKLDEAYSRLAHVVAREALARRREQLKRG